MRYIVYYSILHKWVDQYYIDLIEFFKNDNWVSIPIYTQNDIDKLIFTSQDIVLFFNFLWFNISRINCGYKIYWACDMHTHTREQALVLSTSISSSNLIITQVNSKSYINNVCPILNTKDYISCGWGIKKD